MKLIVGLGNPGEQYTHTRHNLGFMVLEQFLKDVASVRNTIWENNAKFKSGIAVMDWGTKGSRAEKIILAKPQTFMNRSGLAVSALMQFYKIDASDIWIVHDDLDLPLGRMKIRLGGAAAGHHGVEDIMESIGTDSFWRFRLGIGEMRQGVAKIDGEGNEKIVARKIGSNVNEYVLGEFNGKERSEVKKLLKSGSHALEVALEKGLESAMNQFNTK